MRKLRGFTLIELAVVIVVLGLAAVTVLPRLGGAGFERAQLRASASKLATVAAYARDQAACTRLVHVLGIDLNYGTYWVKPTNGRAAIQGKLPEGVRFTDVQVPGGAMGGVAELRFSPDGRADAAAIHLAGDRGCEATVLVAAMQGRTETHEGRLGIDGGGAHDDVARAEQ